MLENENAFFNSKNSVPFTERKSYFADFIVAVMKYVRS